MSRSPKPLLCPGCQSRSPYPHFYEDLEGNRWHFYCANQDPFLHEEFNGNFCFNCDQEFMETPAFDEEKRHWCHSCAIKEWGH